MKIPLDKRSTELWMSCSCVLIQSLTISTEKAVTM